MSIMGEGCCSSGGCSCGQSDKRPVSNEDIMKMLESAEAFAAGHFVYKSGKHGSGYINKERFALLGAEKLDTILRAVVENAELEGMELDGNSMKVLVIGPAYGAIGYAQTIALELSKIFPWITFVPGRTQLDENGAQFLPEKLIELYRSFDEYVVIEDIVNAGSTIRELDRLFKKIFQKGITTAFSIVNRGGQTAETLGINGYYPLFDVGMVQLDPRVSEELQVINSLPPINTVLGKGQKWVEKFGPGPYEIGTDFSAYPFE